MNKLQEFQLIVDGCYLCFSFRSDDVLQLLSLSLSTYDVNVGGAGTPHMRF